MRKSLAVAVVLPLALAPLVAGPAQAKTIVKQVKLQKNIQACFKKEGISVVAKCPKNVTWVKGKTFTCKVVDSQGNKGTVLVTLRSGGSAGKLTWKLLT